MLGWGLVRKHFLTPDEIIAYKEYEELVASNSLFVRSIVKKSPQVLQVEFKLTLNRFVLIFLLLCTTVHSCNYHRPCLLIILVS